MAFRRIQSFGSFPRASSATKMGHGIVGWGWEIFVELFRDMYSAVFWI